MITEKQKNNLAFGGFYHTVLNSRKGVAHNFPKSPTASCLGADLFILLTSQKLIKKYPQEIKVAKAGAGIEEKIIFDISGKAYNEIVFDKGLLSFIFKLVAPKEFRKSLSKSNIPEGNQNRILEKFSYLHPSPNIKSFHFEMPKSHMDAMLHAFEAGVKEKKSFAGRKITSFAQFLLVRKIRRPITTALGENKVWGENFFSISSDIEKSLQRYEPDTANLPTL